MDNRDFRTRDSVLSFFSSLLFFSVYMSSFCETHLMCIFRCILCDIRRMKYLSLFLGRRCYSRSQRLVFVVVRSWTSMHESRSSKLSLTPTAYYIICLYQGIRSSVGPTTVYHILGLGLWIKARDRSELFAVYRREAARRAKERHKSSVAYINSHGGSGLTRRRTWTI